MKKPYTKPAAYKGANLASVAARDVSIRMDT